MAMLTQENCETLFPLWTFLKFVWVGLFYIFVIVFVVSIYNSDHSGNHGDGNSDNNNNYNNSFFFMLSKKRVFTLWFLDNNALTCVPRIWLAFPNIWC